MAYDLIPNSLWSFPSFRIPSVFSEDEDDISVTSGHSGISISEDEKNVYVTAALPGVDEKDIEVTFDKGTLWLKGETRQEENDKKRKFYKRATSSFSYRIAVPGDLDNSKEPEAEVKNGVISVTFAKSPASQPKKLVVKSSSK